MYARVPSHLYISCVELFGKNDKLDASFKLFWIKFTILSKSFLSFSSLCIFCVICWHMFACLALVGKTK